MPSQSRAREREPRRAAAGAYAERAGDDVDGVGRHAAVGRQLAAGDGDDTALRRGHRVAPREVGGAFAARALDERAQAGPRAEDVGLGDRGRDRTVDRAQQVGDVVGRALRVVERTVVVGVGGADVGEVAPRHDEDRAAVLRHRDHRGDVVADLRPRHRDVHTLGRSDRVGMAALVEGAHVVGPHAGRVHDRSRPHQDLGAVGDARTPCTRPARPSRSRRPRRRSPRRRRARPRSGDREREPGVVGAGVVVEVRRREARPRRVGMCSSALSFVMRRWSLPIRSPPVRSYIHIAVPSAARGPVDQPVGAEDREQEGLHPHEVGRDRRSTWRSASAS